MEYRPCFQSDLIFSGSFFSAEIYHADRRIQAYHRRQEPSFASGEISQGNGQDGRRHARTRFLSLCVHDKELGKAVRQSVCIRVVHALGRQAPVEQISLGRRDRSSDRRSRSHAPFRASARMGQVPFESRPHRRARSSRDLGRRSLEGLSRQCGEKRRSSGGKAVVCRHDLIHANRSKKRP